MKKQLNILDIAKDMRRFLESLNYKIYPIVDKVLDNVIAVQKMKYRLLASSQLFYFDVNRSMKKFKTILWYQILILVSWLKIFNY